MQEDIEALKDYELRAIVETDYDKYNLEYIELATAEYIKRGFKNNSAPVVKKQHSSGEYASAKSQTVEETDKMGCFAFALIYGKYIAAIALFIVMWRGCGNSGDSDSTPDPIPRIEGRAKEPENIAQPTQPTYKYYPAGQFQSEGNNFTLTQGRKKSRTA